MPVTFTVPRTSGYATSSRQSLFQIPCVRMEKQLTRQCVNGGVYATSPDLTIPRLVALTGRSVP